MGARSEKYRLNTYDHGNESAIEGPKYKARLVVQGFTEQPCETYSPTPMLQSVRTMLSMACEYEWEIKLADVSTAFLHATVVESTFVGPPTCLSLSMDVCWSLSKALYGLKSAPRSWSQHLAEVVISGGWKQSLVEQSALFTPQTERLTV